MFRLNYYQHTQTQNRFKNEVNEEFIFTLSVISVTADPGMTGSNHIPRNHLNYAELHLSSQHVLWLSPAFPR